MKKTPAVISVAAGLMIRAGMNLQDIEILVRGEVISQAMIMHAGNQCRVARMLGIHRNTLNRAIHILRITTDRRHWCTCNRATNETRASFARATETTDKRSPAQLY